MWLHEAPTEAVRSRVKDVADEAQHSGDNGRPGSAVDGTAKGLAQFSRVHVDPIPPPTVVSLTAAGSVTSFDRRRPRCRLCEQ
jgi:hypothetical protein